MIMVVFGDLRPANWLEPTQLRMWVMFLLVTQTSECTNNNQHRRQPHHNHYHLITRIIQHQTQLNIAYFAKIQSGKHFATNFWQRCQWPGICCPTSAKGRAQISMLFSFLGGKYSKILQTTSKYSCKYKYRVFLDWWKRSKSSGIKVELMMRWFPR